MSTDQQTFGTGAVTRRVSSPRAVLAVAVLGTFMAFVDATIVNIAVPNIAQDLSARGLSSVSWVLNAYNIVFAAFLVAGGQLADLLGRRRVFSLALLTFTVASGLCALAPSLGLLVAARVIQAAGAALLVPSSLAIVLEAHDASERMHAVALWSAVAALAAGIGPPLGGLLITASNWRLVFLVNLPVGLLAAVLAKRFIVESRAPGRRRVPDLLGGLLLALSIAALVLGVVKGQDWGWAGGRVIGSFAAALVLGAWFVLRSGRHRAPVVDLTLLRVRAFALSNGVTVVMAAGFYSYTLCNVLFLTGVWRYSILRAGLALMPGPFTAMAVAGPASRLVERRGHRAVVVPGALVWAGGMLFLATQAGIRPDFLGTWLPGLLILGVGAGLSFPTLSGAAVGSVPGPRFAVATALNSVARQIGAALGVAILIAILGVPNPLDPLPPFRHGWLFAGGCFLAGAIACLGLVVRRLESTPGEVRHPANGLDLGAGAEPIAPAPRPGLLESEGERTETEPQTVAGFLRNVELFAGLSPALLDEVAALAETVQLGRGEWLFREDEEADAVYIVGIGHLEVMQNGESGPEQINTLTRGAVLGELALLSESTRSASVRALRDTQLLRIDKGDFAGLLRSEPELALSLTRILSSQLQASRAVPVARRARPVTIALYGMPGSPDLLGLADELSWEMADSGRVAVLYPGENLARGGDSPTEAAARFAPLIERCESENEQVILVCGHDESSPAWDDFCLARADRVLLAVDANAPVTEGRAGLARLRGSDLIALGVEPGSGRLDAWVEAIDPPAIHAIAERSHAGDVARSARRLTGRAVGAVLAGGGARAFAHLGALEVLIDAGLLVDRVGGVSMGSFIGGMLASGLGPAEMDAHCYDEWVRRNPINDYTVPRNALIRGHKAEAMMDRVFGEGSIEELALPYYCASVNLRDGTLVIDRRGSLKTTIGASMSLPLIAPPLRRGEDLLIDGSLLDNMPLEPMSSTGEGPVLAIDIKGGEERAAGERRPAPASEADGPRPHRRGLPSLPETMSRIALLSSANTGESARRHADLMIGVRVGGVGLLEFHQIDAAREAGRAAAREALESDPPDWLTGAGNGPAGREARRTALRVSL